MARSLTLASAALAFSLLTPVGPAVAADAAVALRHGATLVPVASSSGSDYDKGYRDGFHNLPSRERGNRAYSDGYRAGEARRQAGGAGDGSDYDRGYRDGLDDRGQRDRGNRAYSDGYKAGEASRRSGAHNRNTDDYQRGYRDGYERKTFRDRDRDDKRAYADGFRAGEADRRNGRDGGEYGRARNPGQLVGRSASSLDREMRSMGYEKHGGVKAGGKAFTVWRGRDGPDNCLQVSTKSGRVEGVQPLPESECK